MSKSLMLLRVLYVQESCMFKSVASILKNLF